MATYTATNLNDMNDANPPEGCTPAEINDALRETRDCTKNTVGVAHKLDTGRHFFNLVEKTGNYTVTTDDEVIVCTDSLSLTLYPVSGNIGKWIYVINRDPNKELVTIKSNGTEEIDDSTNDYYLAPDCGILLWCDGDEWYTVPPYIDVKTPRYQFRNLVIKNGATPTTQVRIQADEVVTWDEEISTKPKKYIAESVDVTITTTTSGANGLDTGSIGTNWYYLWVIYNGTTVAGLMSLSATAPTMPSGYTYKALVGAIKYDTDQLIPIYQKDKTCFCDPKLIKDDGNDTDWTSVDMDCPTICKTILGMTQINQNTADNRGATMAVRIDFGGSIGTKNIGGGWWHYADANAVYSFEWELPNEDGSVDYKVVGTGASVDIYRSGWRF